MMNGAAIGGAIAAIYWLLMLVGRTASSAISGKVSSRAQLIVVSATAIIFVLIAIFTPKDVTVSMPGYTVGEGFMMAQVPVSSLVPCTLWSLYFCNVGWYLQPCSRRLRKIYSTGFRNLYDDGCWWWCIAVDPTKHL